MKLEADVEVVSKVGMWISFLGWRLRQDFSLSGGEGGCGGKYSLVEGGPTSNSNPIRLHP